MTRLLTSAEVERAYQDELQTLENQRILNQTQIRSHASNTTLPEVPFGKFDNERRFTNDMLRCASTGLISRSAKRVSLTVKRGKALLDEELESALQNLLELVDGVVKREGKFIYERLRHELFVEVDNLVRRQGVEPEASEIREGTLRIVLKTRTVQPVVVTPWSDNMISRLYNTSFSRHELAPTGEFSGVHQTCAELVERYSLDLYQHLSLIVGEEAWHMIAEAAARLRKTVDSYIAETLEEMETQLLGGLQDVLRQRIEELLSGLNQE